MSSNASSISTGSLAAGTFVVVPRKSFLNSVAVTGDGTNVATVTVFDNASVAAGTVLAVHRTAVAGDTVSAQHTYPIRADNGLVVVVAGVGATAVISYDAA